MDEKVITKGVPTNVYMILRETEQRLESILQRPVTVNYNLKIHNISIDVVRIAVCDVFKLAWSDIIAKNKKTEIIVPRQIFMWIARNYTGKAYQEIARIFNSDHTTCIQAVRRVNNMIETDDELYVTPLRRIEKIILHETEVNA